MMPNKKLFLGVGLLVLKTGLSNMFLADQPGGTGAAAVLRLLGRQRQKIHFWIGATHY